MKAVDRLRRWRGRRTCRASGIVDRDEAGDDAVHRPIARSQSCGHADPGPAGRPMPAHEGGPEGGRKPGRGRSPPRSTPDIAVAAALADLGCCRAACRRADFRRSTDHDAADLPREAWSAVPAQEGLARSERALHARTPSMRDQKLNLRVLIA